VVDLGRILDDDEETGTLWSILGGLLGKGGEGLQRLTATSWTGDSVTEAVDGCCGGGVDGRRDRLKKRGAFLVGLAEASSDEEGRLSAVFWGLHVLAGTLIEVDWVIALFAIGVGGLEQIPLAKEVTGEGGGIFSLSSLTYIKQS